MLNQTKSVTRQSKIRRIIATAKRFLGLVLLLLEAVRRWQDLS